MSRCLMIVVLAGAAPVSLAQQASFEGLGFLSMDFLEHEPESEAEGVSFDGSVVVGDSDIPSKEDPDGKCYDGPAGCVEQDAPRGFRWVDGFGMADLFGYPGEVFCCEVEPFASKAYAVSPDGTWSAGVVYNAEEPSEAAIWSGNGSPQSLGNLGGIDPRLVAIADGGIVAAGYVKIGGDKRPVVSIGGPIEDLVPNLPNAEGEVYAVSNDGMVLLGFLDLGDGSYGAVRWTYDNGYQWSFLDETNPTLATDMSSDGTVIVGRQHVDGEFKAFRHTDADGFEYIDPPEGATSLSLDLVSDDGRVIVGESDVWAGPGIWTAQTGWRELEQVLDDYGVLPIGWTLHDAEGLSGDGTTIVGEAIDPNNYNQAYRAVVPRDDVDTDGDGLPDSWETDGVPYETAEGDTAYYVLDVDGDGVSDADPMHKDLFVEVDLMKTLTFPQAVIDSLVFAFEAAPLTNPDGDTGVTLHIVIDDDTILFDEETVTPENAWPDIAGQHKAMFFGTQDEQMMANAAAMLGAKAKAYRYALIYHKASRSIGGQAELGGDDMLLFFGGQSDNSKASIFMHELGHNLGLRHGGGDDINGKPNYPSIMNYPLAYKKTWNADFWKLDYSREVFATVEENNLNESVPLGLGASGQYDSWSMPYYAVVTDGAECFSERLWGMPKVSYASLKAAPIGESHDWNLDCDMEDNGIAGDLNFLESAALPGSIEPSPGQTFEGYNDWANITLAVSDGGGAFAAPFPADELTEEQLAYIEENFPPPPGTCQADVNGDGVLNILDFVAFQGLFVQQDPGADCDANGQFNILDFVCYQNVFAMGCP